MPSPAQGYLGTDYGVPTDPGYYLGQTGMSQLTPQAFNANTMSAMFSPQGMQFTPANAQATNPFLEMVMKSADSATKLQHRQVPGMEMGGPGAGAPQGY